VRQALRTDDLAKARAQRDILEKADNELWGAMLLDGKESSPAMERYKAARLLSESLGFSYRPIDAGVILRVTPHISRTSEVRSDIEQEVSAVQPNANAATLTPTISQQKVKSTVVVDNGQTVLLAGLISQQRNQEKSGIPGVIDVPIFGNILSSSTNTGKRTELIVFVQPRVIRNNTDAQRVAQELRKRMPGFNSW
jgi:type II secretory pathway component GspD/PulD (secretin)